MTRTYLPRVAEMRAAMMPVSQIVQLFASDRTADLRARFTREVMRVPSKNLAPASAS